MAKRRSVQSERKLQLREYNELRQKIENRNEYNKNVASWISFGTGTASALTAAVLGIALSLSNKPAQSMLVPAVLMGLSYGSGKRIERHYDQKTMEEVQQLREDYKVR